LKTTGLIHSLETLKPYLGDLVICGAWAWYLYRQYLGRGNRLPHDFTRDLDCISRGRIPVRGTPLSGQLDAAGFKWVPQGDDIPPVAHFRWPTIDHPDVEVHFLTPARGDGSQRVVEVQEKVTAEALRNLDILLDDPISVEVDEAKDGSSFRGKVMVPRVGHFVIQKALIFEARSPGDRAKDFAYVFDLIDSAHGLAERVGNDVVAAEKATWLAAVGRFEQRMKSALGSPAFLRAVADQWPLEDRPLVKYLEREVGRWLQRLDQARRPSKTM
jgi:hypothetical protein